MEIQIDRSIPAHGWIEKNLEKMMGMIMVDARHQRPLPLKIAMHPKALQKFIEILRSKSAFFPQPDGSFNFLTVPVKVNSRLPFGSIVLERYKGNVPLLKA